MNLCFLHVSNTVTIFQIYKLHISLHISWSEQVLRPKTWDEWHLNNGEVTTKMWVVTSVSKMTQVSSLLTTRTRKLHGNNTECFQNAEFSWNSEDLTVDPVVGPPILMTIKIVAKIIINKKNGKAAGPLGVVTDMLKASHNIGVWLVTDLANNMIRNGTSHLTGK